MVDTPAPRWEIDLGFGPIHAVEMDPPSPAWRYPRSFRVDGTQHSLGVSIRLTQVAEFAIDGHRAKLTMRLVRPNFRIAFRRALWDPERNSYALSWAACELAVDARSHGTWVATTVGGALQSWTYVEPGGALPTSGNEKWGASAPTPPHPLSSKESEAMFVAVRRAGRREVASFVAAAVIGAVAFGVALVTISMGVPASETGTTNDGARVFLFGTQLAAGLLIGLITAGRAGYAGAAVGYAVAYLAVVTQQIYSLGWSADPSEDLFWFTILAFVVGIGLAVVLAGVFAGRRLRGVAALLRRGERAASGNPRRS